jgi:hypothetical protein
MADENGKLITAINSLRESNSEKLGDIFGQGNQSNDILRDIKKGIEDQLNMSKQKVLDDEETRRESAKKNTADKITKEKDSVDDSFELKGILQILAGIGAAIAGLAVGLVQGFANIVKSAVKFFRARIAFMFAPFARFIDAISDVFGKRGTGQIFKGNTYKTLGRLTGLFRSFADAIKGLENRFSSVLKSLKSFGALVRSYAGMLANTIKGVAQLGIEKALASIKRGVSGLTGFLKSIAGLGNFADIKKSLPDLKALQGLKNLLSDKIVKPFQNFINGIRGVGQSTSVLGKTLARFFGAFKIIGRFIAFPLTIIMGIIDGFKGLQAGADRQLGLFDKIIGGTIGAITGVLKGLVAMPLDLIKSAVSWIAEKIFGEDNFLTKFLDSFSFSDMFQMVGDRIADSFVKFFNGIIYWFSDIKEKLMKPFEEGFSLSGIIEFGASLPSILVGGIFDFVKNAASSLLDLFGFEDAAKFLDSFKFTDILLNMIGRVGMFLSDTLGSLFSDLKNIFKGDGPLLDRVLKFVRNLVTSLYTWPMDLLKNAVSGIFGLFGYDDISQQLDSFSFKDAFGKIIDWVIALPGRLVDGLMGILSGEIDVGQMISDAMTSVGDMASQFNDYLKSIAKPRLSALAKDDSWFGKLGNFLVPKQAFEWAGVNPDTGEIAAPKISAPEVTAQTDRGSQVANMSRENASAKAGASVAIVNAPVQQTTQNVSNNSTAAIIDQNLPTVDYNDRSWGFA